jgi:hypothetical protein
MIKCDDERPWLLLQSLAPLIPQWPTKQTKEKQMKTCLILLLVITQSAFAQAISWGYDVKEGATKEEIDRAINECAYDVAKNIPDISGDVVLTRSKSLADEIKALKEMNQILRKRELMVLCLKSKGFTKNPALIDKSQ